MKILIAEDDFASRRILKELLKAYGDCDITVNGQEAVDAFRMAHEAKRPYELIMMDIMMPKVDGLEALKQIRNLEREMDIPPNLEVKVIMTTALGDPKTVIKAYYESEATSYIVKPLSRKKIDTELQKLNLVKA